MKTGNTTSPIPAPGPAGEPAESIAEAAPESKKKLIIIGGIAAVLVLGGGFFAYTKFLKPAPLSPAPPPVAKKTTPAAPAKVPSPAPAPKASAPSPSDTANAIANAPAAAVNKAKQVIANRNGANQAGADAIVDANKPALPAGKDSGPPAASTSTATTSLSPGITATTNVEVAAEATPEFRSFVANARVGGVFQGNPPRALVNGRLAHAGETVDSSLGIMFEGIDAERKLIIFKDKTGATVARKY